MSRDQVILSQMISPPQAPIHIVRSATKQIIQRDLMSEFGLDSISPSNRTVNSMMMEAIC